MRRRLMTLVVAACLAAGAAACGDDGEGGFLGAADGGGGAEGANGENGSSGSGGIPGPSSGGDGGGYTDSMRSNFMSQCANYPGTSESLCGCAWESVTQTVPVEEYRDWERTYDASSSLPDWLTAAVAACS